MNHLGLQMSHSWPVQFSSARQTHTATHALTLYGPWLNRRVIWTTSLKANLLTHQCTACKVSYSDVIAVCEGWRSEDRGSWRATSSQRVRQQHTTYLWGRCNWHSFSCLTHPSLVSAGYCKTPLTPDTLQRYFTTQQTSLRPWWHAIRYEQKCCLNI